MAFLAPLAEIAAPLLEGAGMAKSANFMGKVGRVGNFMGELKKAGGGGGGGEQQTLPPRPETQQYASLKGSGGA
jgi:hypothetical protein